ncbi:MAG: HWE histidine kinase domain-containing protein [Sulfitobacter sp.]
MDAQINELKAENARLKQQLAAAQSATGADIFPSETVNDRISFLEAMLEAMPIGIILAEAPSGKIVMGNKRAEEMVRHKIFNSSDVDSYGEWISFHEDGRQVESHEYPLSKVIRDGEDYSELDVRYQRGDGTHFWMRLVCRPVFSADGSRRGATVAMIDIDQERHLLGQQSILIAELNHRVKNAFTVVKSIVSQSLRGTGAQKDVRDTIDNRLDAYAKAHSQLIGNRWDSASVEDIARATIQQIAGDRITFTGPNVHVPSRNAMALSMAFYELATNAVKHGSLSDLEGHVVLNWQYVTPTQTAIQLDWVELGGPVPVSPTTKGFGSKIINQILTAETRGTVAIAYPETGFTWRLEMPLDEQE